MVREDDAPLGNNPINDGGSSTYSSEYEKYEYCNILLVGIGFNRKLLSQIDKSSNSDLMNISNCLDKNGVQILQGVARDTFRAAMIEQDYCCHRVSTVHKCQDHMRNDAKDNDTNLNCDCNTRHFIKNIVQK